MEPTIDVHDYGRFSSKNDGFRTLDAINHRELVATGEALFSAGAAELPAAARRRASSRNGSSNSCRR